MPTASAHTASHFQQEKVSQRQLRQLVEEAKYLIFSDFDAAQQRLDALRGALFADLGFPHSDVDLPVPESPNLASGIVEIHPAELFDIRLDYHVLAGFLENQQHRYAPAAQHFAQAIEWLDSLADPLRLADAWLDLAAVHANQRDLAKAENALQRADQLLNENPETALVARLATRQGFLQMLLKNDEHALAWLLEAEQQYAQIGDEATLKDHFYHAQNLSGLGQIHDRLGDKQHSTEAFFQVLRLCERHQLRPRIGWHYLNGGRAQLGIDNTELAAEFFQNALRLAEPADLNLQANALANLGIVALMNDEPAEAMQLLDRASDLFKNPTRPEEFHNLLIIEAWKAKAYVQIGQPDEAQIHFEKAVQHGERCGDWEQLEKVCREMAKHQAERGDHRQAYENQCRAAQFAARRDAESHAREIVEIEARFELEKQRREASVAKLRLNHLQLRALRAQMNPHFLFNALNAVQSQITSGDTDAAEKSLARFAKFMRRTLDYSDLEETTLATELEFLEQYLELNRRLRFQERFSFSLVCADDVDADDVRIPTMIIQPFLENAIEHGLRPQQGGSLFVHFQWVEDETMLLCTIEDDGIGYLTSRERRAAEGQYASHKSKGMDITKERLELLHGSPDEWVSILDLGQKSEGRQRGTRVSVLLPVFE